MSEDAERRLDKITGRYEMKCCRACGRDTTTADCICNICRGTTQQAGKGRGRRALNRDQIESLDHLEDQARANNDGWYYDDDDYKNG